MGTDGTAPGAPGIGPALSVVIPVYNEEGNLRALVDELRGVLDGLAGEWELLLVNDGSTDGSGGLIAALSGGDARVRGLHLRRNAGQTAAFAAGFRAARGRVIVTMDADLQNDPADIPVLLDRLAAEGGPDAVAGWRRERRDGVVKRVASRIGNAVRNALTGDRIRDTGCSLKAFRAGAVRGLPLFDGMHRFLPTLLRMQGFRVEEVPVRHRPRASGRSKYGISNRAVRGFVDTLAVRWMMRRRLDGSLVEEPSRRAAVGEDNHAG